MSRNDHRRGFTLVEVMVVSVLMTFVAALVSAAWATIGGPTVSLIRRSQCIQEIDMAAASLARDLGGQLPGSIHGKRLGRFTSWSYSDNTLYLNFKGSSGTDTVSYSLSGTRLVRKENGANAFTAARNVQSFQVVDYSGYIEITLTFKFIIGRQTLTRLCTLKVKQPALSSD